MARAVFPTDYYGDYARYLDYDGSCWYGYPFFDPQEALKAKREMQERGQECRLIEEKSVDPTGREYKLWRQWYRLH